MKTSAAGRAAIAQREGNKLKAYTDTVGVLTIGVGHTSAAGPPKVTKGMTITAAQSDEILSRDLADTEAAVNSAVKVPVSQKQFDAMVSLAFNIGGGAFKKSTIVKRLNAGDVAGAAAAFMMWNKPKEIIGRRKTEQTQFLMKPAVAPAVAKDLPAAPAPNATVTIADGPKKDETIVVVAKTPQAPPASPGLPTSKTGFMAIGAIIIALITGAAKHFGG